MKFLDFKKFYWLFKVPSVTNTIDILIVLYEMSVSTPVALEKDENVFTSEMEKLTCDNLIYTQCGSAAFYSIHKFSQYILKFQIIEILTFERLLEDLSKTSVEGEYTEETFLCIDAPHDDLKYPDKKLTLLKKNPIIKYVGKRDPELKKFWHYHLYHLICRYMFLCEDNSNVKKLLGNRLYKMRKKCWYFLCHSTYVATSDPQYSEDFTDKEFKSNVSRYTQAHHWYIAKDVQEYSTSLRNFNKNSLNDIRVPIDVNTPYWKEIQSSFHEINELILKVPARELPSSTSDDKKTPSEMVSETSSAKPPVIARTSPIVATTIEKFTYSALDNQYATIYSTMKSMQNAAFDVLQQTDTLGRQMETYRSYLSFAHQQIPLINRDEEIASVVKVVNAFPEITKTIQTAFDSFFEVITTCVDA